MDFKIGDKVRVISLLDTKKRYNLDPFGYMETCLNKVFTIRDIKGNGIRFEHEVYMYSKYDLILVNNTTLEIE